MRSSVARLPTAPGPANGQPPSPPAELSRIVIPRSSAAYTLASAWPRVSCAWSPTRVAGTTRRTASRTRRMSPGVAAPIVSPRLISSQPRSISRAATEAVKAGETGPSYGQPNATDT